MKTAALLALLLLAGLSRSTFAKVTCANQWHSGTLAFQTIFDPGGIFLTFIDPGQGGDPEVCTENPDVCSEFLCQAESATGASCSDAVAGHCFDYIVASCWDGPVALPPTIRALNDIDLGPCP